MRPAGPELVVAAARGWIGTPYHDQASLRGVGCDCLGLARGVWREVTGPEPEGLPPYSRDWGETGAREVLLEGALRWMIPVAVSPTPVGACLLFRMHDRAIAKHIGILVAPGIMIHASENTGVVEEAFGPAWLRRAVAAFLFPAEVP
jgi:NlpC/P60 family putative phage cell wall peptidase